jgi:hypothetical protein
MGNGGTPQVLPVLGNHEKHAGSKCVTRTCTTCDLAHVDPLEEGRLDAKTFTTTQLHCVNQYFGFR